MISKIIHIFKHLYYVVLIYTKGTVIILEVNIWNLFKLILIVFLTPKTLVKVNEIVETALCMY